MFYNNKYNACSQCATNRLVSEMHHQGCICSCHSGIVIKLKNKATLNHPFLVFSYPAELYWEYRLTVSICIIKNMVYWIYKMEVQINLFDFLENFIYSISGNGKVCASLSYTSTSYFLRRVSRSRYTRLFDLFIQCNTM